MGRLRDWLAALLVLCLVFAGAPAVAQSGDAQPLAIRTSKGLFAFSVEIADTPEARARGLMFRAELAPDKGMLFAYEVPVRPTFWMRNTTIPLDMIFIRADGSVAGFAAGAVPLSEEIVSFDEPVKAVLEVPAGTAAHIGLRPGDRVEHALFAR